VKDAALRADAIYALEEKIATAHWPAADRRDADKTYNPMPISALAKFAPQFPWNAYLAATKISPRTPSGERVVIVSEKSAFPTLAAIFDATPVEVWRDYLTVRELHAFAMISRRRWTIATSPSSARSLPARSSSCHETSVASDSSTSDWEKRLGSSMSPGTFRRRRRPKRSCW
jgi:hypothetical protein